MSRPLHSSPMPSRRSWPPALSLTATRECQGMSVSDHGQLTVCVCACICMYVHVVCMLVLCSVQTRGCWNILVHNSERFCQCHCTG